MSGIADLFDVNRRELRRHLKTVEQINQLECRFAPLGQGALRQRFDELRARAEDGEELEELAVECFAITREAVRRALGIRLHDLQVAGALVVAGEELAEMRGGEGKTVSAMLPVCLWALRGRGVHALAADGPHARQSAVWLGGAYRSLGLSVGVLLPGFHEAAVVDPDRRAEPADGALPAGLRPSSRREAYDCDVTYGTFPRLAGDYLQDQMVSRTEQQVQRGLAAAIVDDADDVLLQHGSAITLVASRPTRECERFSRICGATDRFDEGVDFRAGDGGAISLLPPGRVALARALRAADLNGDLGPSDLADVTLALRGGTHVRAARAGSVAPGTTFVIDLDAAIPPAPALPADSGWEVWGRISVPSLLGLYESLGGLAGAALSSAATLDAHCELDVVPVPRSAPLHRDDRPDSIFATSEEKLEAVVAEAQEMSARGRPVVIGTATWGTTARIHEKLSAGGLVESRHGEGLEEEAPPMVVTGHATRLHPDELSSGLQARGGLHVIGAEHGFWRFEDEAVRDLAGRRGQPGSTHFFSSAEDPTLRAGNGELPDDMAAALTAGSGAEALAAAVERRQQHREEARVAITQETAFRLEREDAQRESVCDRLDEARGGDPRRLFEDLIRTVIEESVQRWHGNAARGDWAERLVADLAQVFPLGAGAEIPAERLSDEDPDLVEFLLDAALKALDAKEAELGGAVVARERERHVLLRTWCRMWRDQLPDLDRVWSELEAGGCDVSAISPYRGWVPLARYQQFPVLASQAFEGRLAAVPRAAVRALFRARPPATVVARAVRR